MAAVAKCSGHLVDGSKELTMDKIEGIIFLDSAVVKNELHEGNIWG
jgi:hypothetical protein